MDPEPGDESRETLIATGERTLAPSRAETGAEYERRVRESLARQLHDGPVQELTAMILMFRSYRRAVPDRRMQHAVDILEASARRALGSLRSMVADYRGETPAAGLDLVERLRTRELPRAVDLYGLEVELDAGRGWPASLPADVVEGLVAIAVEGLANAGRHSGGRRAVVRLRATATRLTVTVEDDGPPAAARSYEPGDGLRGARERAALLGGDVKAGPRPGGGGRLRASFPRRDLE